MKSFFKNLIGWMLFALLLFILFRAFLSQDEMKIYFGFADEIIAQYAIKVIAFFLFLVYVLIIRFDISSLFRSKQEGN